MLISNQSRPTLNFAQEGRDLQFKMAGAFGAKIDDKFECKGVTSNNRNFRIQVQAQAMLIFFP